MSAQLQRISDATEPDSQGRSRCETQGSIAYHSGLILLASGFGILVLRVFITGLGVVNRATRLFDEVSAINTKFRRLSLDLERLHSDMFLAGSYVRDQLFDSESVKRHLLSAQFLITS